MTKKKESNKDTLDLFNFVKIFVKKLPNETFLDKKPNNNSPFEEALAISSMSGMNLFVYIKESVDKDNSLVAGILLRSLIETAANIRFIAENKKDSEMISKFLETSNLVADKLYDLKSNDLSKGIKWTNVPITERIKLLDHKGVNYLAAWHYFSSYSHSDAGYLGSYVHEHKSNMCNIILGLNCIVFIEIGEALDLADVLKDGFGKMFVEAASEYLNSNK